MSIGIDWAELAAQAESDLSAAQKKITELEAERDARTQAIAASDADIAKTLTAERQQRESAETALRLFADFRSCPEPVRSRSAFDQARDHFTRYPTASDSEERGG